MVAFRADGVLQTTIADGTFPVRFENELYDVQNGLPADNYDPVTWIFTAPLDGIYRFTATVNGTRTSDQPTVIISIVSDSGAPPIQEWFTAGDFAGVIDNYGVSVVGDFLLAAGQTVRVLSTVVDGTFQYAPVAEANRTFTGSLVGRVS